MINGKSNVMATLKNYIKYNAIAFSAKTKQNKANQTKSLLIKTQQQIQYH